MTIHDSVSLKQARLAAVATFLALASPAVAEDAGSVKGALIANGKPVELPYVYVWVEKEGFYESGDPTWRILFVERELAEREIDEPIWDAAWVEIGITETSEFADKPELQIYSQSIKLAADSGGNLSGGTYPQFEIAGLGTERVSGRIYHSETQEFFDDTYSYDFTFSAALSDPDAPIGDPLPAGGGDPGAAYLKWVETVHTGELKDLRSIVPPEMAAQLDSITEAEAREELEFMRAFTPKEVKIVSGSSDGETAILEIEGVIEGEAITGEITMTKMGDLWVPTNSSM